MARNQAEAFVTHFDNHGGCNFVEYLRTKKSNERHSFEENVSTWMFDDGSRIEVADPDGTDSCGATNGFVIRSARC